MLPIQSILHPTDFSEGAAAALEHALHLARRHEADLHLLHVVPGLGEDPIRNAFDAAVEDNVFMRQLWAEADAQMKALVEAHRDRHVSLRRVLARGPAAGPIILEYAEAEAIDVIVMGTHGRRGLRHLLLGSVAEEVVHQAACHVMTVRGQEGPADEPRPIQRILVPLDLSEHSAPLLRTAREMAGGYGAELHLLHVIQPLPFPVSAMTPLSIYDLAPRIREEAQARLQALFEATPGPDVPALYHVVEGHPARTIVQMAAQEEADLIVIAPRGLTGVERFVLGSVAEHVVRAAACPVFVVKSEAFAATDAPAEAAGAYEK